MMQTNVIGSMFKSCQVIFALLLLFITGSIVLACSSTLPTPSNVSVLDEAQDTSLNLHSKAFSQGEAIPAKYTCTADDVSPPLQWNGVPSNAKSLALIMADPDAPGRTWDHWLIFNLPPDTQSLPEDAPLPAGSRPGKNSWRRTDYGGPCPPGGTHRYFFNLYALDSILDLEEGATKDEILAAMEGHILAQTELVGTYSK